MCRCDTHHTPQHAAQLSNWPDSSATGLWLLWVACVAQAHTLQLVAAGMCTVSTSSHGLPRQLPNPRHWCRPAALDFTTPHPLLSCAG